MSEIKYDPEGIEIVKVDSDLRLVFGWASVITEKNKPVIDTDGDVIHAGVLLEATTEFMEDVRTAKRMHKGSKIGEVLHSFPLTNDIAKSLGLDLKGREGWIVGMKVHDDETWELVKEGKLKAFSIGGRAATQEIE